MFLKSKDHKYAIVKSYDILRDGSMFYEIIEYDEAKLETLTTISFHLEGKIVKSVFYGYICGVNYPTQLFAEQTRASMIGANDNCICNCDSDEDDDLEDDIMYVVTGEYPNLAISAKFIESRDEFSICLREVESDNISIHPNDRCFDTYEEANNKVIELIQKATSTKKK